MHGSVLSREQHELFTITAVIMLTLTCNIVVQYYRRGKLRVGYIHGLNCVSSVSVPYTCPRL